nr:tRNA lysidine(34) synthetase TilS [Maritimibacter dapengensis]
MRKARERDPFDCLCVAVSGGGDSMALLHMVAPWARRAGVAVRAVTVDHRLRDASADEAKAVAATCATLGLPHDTLVWEEAGGASLGNLPAAARAARYDLIAAKITDVHGEAACPILLAHTSDDVAETFMMRMARGSGVDGLARMRDDWRDRGQRWLRPLLDASRAELRDWLTGQGIGWIEDPTNDDPRYDRARIRAGLADLGIDTGRIAETAQRMASARDVLRRHAFEKAQGICRVEAGDVLIDLPGLSRLPTETEYRLLTHALRWVSTATYRPRQKSLVEAIEDIARTGKTTLSGCLMVRKGDVLRIVREYDKVGDLRSGPEALWDNRWRLDAPDALDLQGLEIGCLGPKGLKSVPDWRKLGIPRDTLLVSPAVWRGETLVAAPLADPTSGWSAKIHHPWGDFFTSILSH